jgi:hypothetical protein
MLGVDGVESKAGVGLAGGVGAAAQPTASRKTQGAMRKARVALSIFMAGSSKRGRFRLLRPTL